MHRTGRGAAARPQMKRRLRAACADLIEEHEPDTRRDNPGASGHATTKSSIHKGTYLINPASMHRREDD